MVDEEKKTYRWTIELIVSVFALVVAGGSVALSVYGMRFANDRYGMDHERASARLEETVGNMADVSFRRFAELYSRLEIPNPVPANLAGGLGMTIETINETVIEIAVEFESLLPQSEDTLTEIERKRNTAISITTLIDEMSDEIDVYLGDLGENEDAREHLLFRAGILNKWQTVRRVLDGESRYKFSVMVFSENDQSGTED